MKTKEQIIDEILNRGIIVDIIPSKAEFKQRLLNDKLRFFIGADRMFWGIYSLGVDASE